MPLSERAAAVRAKRESSSRVLRPCSGSAGNTIATRCRSPAMIFLPLLAVGEPAECRNAIGFGPKADHAALRERCVLDREKGLAVEDDVEAGAHELDTQGVPLV